MIGVSPPGENEEVILIEELTFDLTDEWSEESSTFRTREARRLMPPPWAAAARRPPWSAVLPAAPPPAPERDAVVLEVPLTSVPLAMPESEGDPAPTPPKLRIGAGLDGTPTGMVLVPQRTVRRAERTFQVEPFFLDRDVVTQEEWARYLVDARVPAPEGWRTRRPPPGQERCPMTTVTFDEARDFAAWRGARLPTVAEWLAAAAGLSWFPHENETCPAGLCACPRAGAPEALAPVGTHPLSNSDEGVRDLLGLVWEWCETDTRLPGPDVDFQWVLGGSYKHVCPGATPSTRTVPQSTVHRRSASPFLGFRCAQNRG